MPDFRSPEFLLGHIRHTLSFYDARCVDPSGGFFHFYKDDGTVYDRRTRHLVSSTRFVFNHAMAFRRFGSRPYQQRGAPRRWPSCSRRMRSRRAAMRGSSTGTTGRATVQDGTNHCYGLAFVLLAHAHALMAGVGEARGGPGGDLAADGAALLGRPQRPVCRRGHARLAASAPTAARTPTCTRCEAMIAAYDATREPQVSAARADAGRVRHRAPGRAGRRPGVGALPRRAEAAGRSTGTTTATTRPTSSAPGATRPAT